MPLGSRGHVPGDPLEWLPMRPFPGRRHVPLEDPIVEPLWSGVRILAHVSASRAGGMAPVVRLVEEVGADLAPELPELAAALGAGVDADEAVIDGLVTRQVGLEGVGAAAIPEIRASGSRLLLGGAGELDIRPRGRAVEGTSSAREGFVAVDLLRLDGITLLDVPLLERKRLLESVMRPGDLVRISVHARPPYETWVATWKALGLRGGILKAANSHYRPGARSPEWRIVETVGRRGR